MARETQVSQHFVEKIKISPINELSSGSKTRDIHVHDNEGKKLEITLFGDTEEDLEVEIK